MKKIVLHGFAAFILMVSLSACASPSGSEQDSDIGAQTGVIEAPIGTVEIEGMTIALPCAFADLPVYPVSNESNWLAPQESHYSDEMLDQQITFRIDENSTQNYTLYCAFPKNEDYHSGIVYSLNFSSESEKLIYQGEEYVFGETTEQEIETRLGTNCDKSAGGLLRNYNYQNGTVSIFTSGEKLTEMIIRSTMIAD